MKRCEARAKVYEVNNGIALMNAMTTIEETDRP
jgi:hypothetical protein